ncbi:MAG: polyprenyl synthetase [Flavobacteriaceae bacterium]|nr:polyprenyl synthetase [Flavobacteriaceae bacterium]RCL66500.1 MAG: polyprenyl synthetase family protein [Cryomorphaceae bacterium]|tara:strand:+ start:3931 stop:4908 length:978 start_codon:yes stop_codon:yes gene_type:complete
MKEIEKIKFPIKKEMELFEAKFLKSMNSNVPLLNRITHYVVNRKGKQMRPMFVFLTAKMITNGVINEKVYRAASVIELIHTATLVHDDVVDSSYMRRGFFSLNALWKNKIAVLVGDFLLSKGMLLCIDNDDFDLLKLISKSVKDMSQGELLQIEKARRLDIDEETYFEIVRKKTASLISSCCALGASASGVSKDKIDQFSNFGEKIGIAFQLKDDLFDYGEKKIGKPTGIDIREKKLTLPLIYTLNNSSKSKKRWLINCIKNHNNDKKVVKEVINYVKESGGIEYTVLKLKSFQKAAIDTLNDYPDNQYKQSLIELVNYVIEREY